MKEFNDPNRLFVFDREKYQELFKKDYCIPEPPSVTEVENGVVLPLIRRTDVADKRFMGGVCDQEGNFVAGLLRNLDSPDSETSCVKAYPLPHYIPARHETVIFGGVLIDHFGHLITDCFARLWWFTEHTDTPYKLIFLDSYIHGTPFQYSYILNAIGITDDRMEIITAATRFDKIIIPEQTLYLKSNYRVGVTKIYDYIRSKVTTGPYKKVYLSRTALPRQDTVNEEYFENFYSKRGYQIVHPEQIPFWEQVSIMTGAEDVVMVSGSLLHLSQFCNSKTRFTILNRSDQLVKAFIICLQAFDQKNYYFIDANFNFLPANLTGGHGRYLLGPTEQWIRYLNEAGIPYEPEEISVDLYVKPYIYDYLVKWGEIYGASNIAYKCIRNTTMVDVVSNVNRFFLQKQINKKAYADRDDVTKIKKENASVKNKIADYERLFQAALANQAYDHKALAERNDIIALKKEIAALRKRPLVEQDEILALKEEIATLRNILAGRDDVMALKKEIVTFRETISTLERAVQTALENQAKRQDALADRAELQQENTALRNNVTALERIFKTALERQARRHPAAVQKAAESTNLNAIIIVDQAEVQQLQNKIDRLEHKMSGMENSLSWRITKPLRAFKVWLKKIFK